MPAHDTPLVAEIESVHPSHGQAGTAWTAPSAGTSPAAMSPDRVSRGPLRPADTDRMAELPYGPFLQWTLPGLSRAFRLLNRFYVLPAIKAGLGPLHATPLTGSWMLLRTTGRCTGRPREVALGYALLDGNVYCSAGFGRRTAWYRNLLAEPRVEVVLPAGGFAGIAEPVTEPAELDRAWRALIRSLGILGRVFVCAPDAPPAQLAASTANIPLVRIRTVGLASGPFDPGGRFWVIPTVLGLAWIAGRLRARVRGRRTRRPGPSGS